MADDNVAVQQPQAVAPAAEQAAPAAPTVQPVEPTATVAPPGGGGLTVEQLQTEIANRDRIINEALERAARAEHEATYTRNLIEQYGPKKQETEEEKPPFTNEEFIADPGAALAKGLREIKSSFRAELEKRDNQRKAEVAKERFLSGREKAIKQHGKLLSGIESRVANEVARGLMDGVISPEAADDPKVWATTALAIRLGEQNETSFDKYFTAQEHINPMKTVYTETPTAGTPPKVDVQLSEDDKLTAKSWGITEEQMLAEKRRSIAEKARLAR